MPGRGSRLDVVCGVIVPTRRNSKSKRSAPWQQCKSFRCNLLRDLNWMEMGLPVPDCRYLHAGRPLAGASFFRLHAIAVQFTSVIQLQGYVGSRAYPTLLVLESRKNQNTGDFRLWCCSSPSLSSPLNFSLLLSYLHWGLEEILFTTRVA